MTMDGIRERERGRKRRRWAELTTYKVFRSFLHVTDNSMGSMIPLWTGYYPAAQTGFVGWFKGPYFELSITWSNSKFSRTIQGSCNPMRCWDWVLSSYALRMGLNILNAQHIPSQQTPLSIDAYASCAIRGLFEIRVYPSSLDWSVKASSSEGECFHPRTSLKTALREDSAQDFLIRGYLRSAVI